MPRKPRTPKPKKTEHQQNQEAEAAHHEAVNDALADIPDSALEFDPAKLEAPNNPERDENPPKPPEQAEVLPIGNTDRQEQQEKLAAAEAAAPVTRASELDEPETTHHSHKRFGVYRDSKNGVRIDKETERQHGQNGLRVLVSFRDKPSDEERQTLKDNGFRFDGGSWTKPLNAANVETAKRTVNQILKGRGDDYQIMV